MGVRMGARAIERRKLSKSGDSFVIRPVLSELKREGLIEKDDDGEWQLVDEDAEVIVEHHENGEIRARPAKD